MSTSEIRESRKTVDRFWQEIPIAITGVYWWNHNSIKGLFEANGNSFKICSDFSSAFEYAQNNNGGVLAWASRLNVEEEEKCQEANIPLARIEDGFLRSIGLGAGLAPAASVIIDGQGIYYDPSQPSDIETMLASEELVPDQIERARVLREKILAAKLSKYNLGKTWQKPKVNDGKQKILVPGQVADDAAIVKTISNRLDLDDLECVNLELVRAAREENPDGFIIFKPHPDVEAGLRKGKLKPSDVLQYADQIAVEANIIELIDWCDKVETISSLSGFEALLRNKEVSVYGAPFYAGWGLTKDFVLFKRRGRKRSLDELVYLTLVSYSLYVNPNSFKKCEAEELVEALVAQRQKSWIKLKNAVALRLAWMWERLTFKF